MLLSNPPINQSQNPIIHLRVGSNGETSLETLLSSLRTQILPHVSMLSGEIDPSGNIVIYIEGSEDMTGEQMGLLINLHRAISEEEDVGMHLLQFSLQEE